MKSTGYFTKIATWKVGKYLKIWERKTRDQEFACLLACLADTEKGTCCKSLLKTVFPFFTKPWNFAHIVLLALFYHVNFTWLSCKWIWLRFLIKPPRGVNIIQFHSISVTFGHMYFLFQSLDNGASENLSERHVFKSDLF